MGEVESYRYSIDMEVVTTSDDVITTLPISVEGAYRAPDRYSAVLNLNMGFFGSFEIPIIAIGSAVYIRDPNFGEWDKIGASDDLSYLDPDFIAFLANPAASIPPGGVRNLRNLRLGAEKTADDGTMVQVVSFALPDGGSEDAYPKLGEVEATIEIGVADSIMRRVEAFGDISRRKDAVVLPAPPGGFAPRGAYPERRVSFRSSAILRDFGGVAEPIEPPILATSP